MAETGVWVNPTMHDIRAWLWYYRDEEAAGRKLDATEVTSRDELRRLYDDKLDAVRRLHAAGVKLIAGSDSAWGRSPAGGGWLEIDALTDAGLSPAEAIAAGTTGSAAAIGVGDIAGFLEPGRPADLLVVGRDPHRRPCRAQRILSTSSKTVAASREAAQERTHEGRHRGLPGCRGRLRTGHRQHLRSAAVLRTATVLGAATRPWIAPKRHRWPAAERCEGRCTLGTAP